MTAPLLDATLQAAATTRLREIAAALDCPHEDWILSRRADTNGLRSISFALGRCGTAVFEAWLYRAGLDDSAADRAFGHLQASIELLPTLTMDLSLLCGFPSVAWTTEHLLRVLEIEVDHDINASVDETILEALGDASFTPAYDLIDGLAGLAVYALARVGRPTALPMLVAILDRLEATACAQEVGLSWPSGQITRAAQGKDIPTDETYFNLGLSHGVPGVIGSLARMHRIDALRPRVQPLLEGSVAWLQTQRIAGDPGNRGMYPDFTATQTAPEPARLAWCYGDPGVAAALIAAAQALGSESVREFGLSVAHAAARRALSTSSIVDDGICHGSAGVAHAFHRIYQATGDPVCGQAALEWLGRLLQRKDVVPNVAGFSTFCFERVREGEYIEDPAALTGAAGVGLVLLSGLSPEPDWDQSLLLDLHR